MPPKQPSVKGKPKLTKLQNPFLDAGTAKKRKAPRFRPITHALRAIRREQKKHSELSFRRGPFRDLVRQEVYELDRDSQLRPSTVHVIQEHGEGFLTTVLMHGHTRRLEGLTPGQRKQQICVQVSSRNIEGAFHALTFDKPGPYKEEFQRALEELRSA